VERPGQRLLAASSLAHLVERQVVDGPECVAVDDSYPVTACVAEYLGGPLGSQGQPSIRGAEASELVWSF
jgi:hypothetical protein